MFKKLLGKLAGLIEFKAPTDGAPFHQSGKIVFRGGIRIEWSLGRLDGPHIRVTADPDDADVTISIGGPLATLWLSIPDLKRRFHGVAAKLARTDHWWEGIDVINVYIYDGALWWNFLHSTYQSKSTDPWWSKWSFDPLDFALGGIVREDVEVGDETVELGFPEGEYAWRVRTFATTLRRPRWPWPWGDAFSTYRAEAIGDDDSIPIPGKGENAWDCGPDYISAQSGPGVLTDAIGAIYASVLRTRMQRCGKAFYDERPRPIEPAVSTLANILDDPRMDGRQWIVPTDEECNAWPFWEYREYHPHNVNVITVLTSEQVLALPQEAIVCPLRMPGMNERGEVDGVNMTDEHLARTEWQVRYPDRWMGVPSYSNDVKVVLAQRRDRKWRPAIFAQLDSKPPASAIEERPYDSTLDPDLDDE